MPLCTLVDNSRLELECVIPSYQLATMRAGAACDISRLPPGAIAALKEPFRRSIRTIESDNRSGEGEVENCQSRRGAAQRHVCRGEIITGREHAALVIPRDSLIPEKEGSETAGVYVVRDGKAHRSRDKDRRQPAGSVWVRQGLQEGDLVITEIGPSLKEGTPVRVSIRQWCTSRSGRPQVQ